MEKDKGDIDGASSKKDLKKLSEGTIRFKETRDKSETLKRILKIISIILISFLFGMLGAQYIIESRYGMQIRDKKTVFQIVDSNDGSALGTDYEMTKAISEIAPSIVSIADSEEHVINNKISCTGFVIKDDGYIITSYSAIKDFNKIIVKLSSVGSKPFDGELLGFDEFTDLALLKIDATGLKKIDFDDKEEQKVGNIVLAVGNNIGDNYIGLVTFGIINSNNKTVERGKLESADKRRVKVIQTDAVLNNENNGGVLINIHGKVIGVNNLYFSKKHSTDGFNLSLEINEVQNTINSIINFGKVKRAVLGFEGAAVRKNNNSDIEGVYVKNVHNGSAEKAGIRPTDIIIEFEGHKIRKLEDIIDIVSKHKVGDQINCKVLRNGDIIDLTIDLFDDK